MIINPFEAQKLQGYNRGIAEILYKNTDKTALVFKETIEKSVRQQILEHVSPQVAFFSADNSQEQREVERDT